MCNWRGLGNNERTSEKFNWDLLKEKPGSHEDIFFWK